MLAITLETAKNTAIVVMIVLIVFAILIARFVANVTMKAIALLVVAAVALGVWTQRKSLVDCADKVKATAAATSTGTGSTTCSFFGSDITITAPQAGG